MTCEKHGGNEGSIMCRQCDAETIERHSQDHSACPMCGAAATLAIKLPEGGPVPAASMAEAQRLLRKHQRDWPNEDLSITVAAVAERPVQGTAPECDECDSPAVVFVAEAFGGPMFCAQHAADLIQAAKREMDEARAGNAAGSSDEFEVCGRLYYYRDPYGSLFALKEPISGRAEVATQPIYKKRSEKPVDALAGKDATHG